MFFIVSTGRSGTTTIAELLSSVAGCICLHEPEPALILESSAYRYGEIDGRQIISLLRETRPSHLNGRLYCESNQTLSLIIPLLAETFPGARFIWLLRNGLDVVASAMQKQWYSGFSENHARYEDCTPTQKAWIDGRIRGDRCGAMSAAEWAGLDRFAKCCWYWAYVNRLIAHDLNSLAPSAHFLLRLETLPGQLPSLLAWMGLETAELPPIPQQNSAKRPPYHWSKWSGEERRTFEHWCGEQMDAWYPEWRDAAGNWQGVSYQTPPARSQLTYLLTSLRSLARRLR